LFIFLCSPMAPLNNLSSSAQKSGKYLGTFAIALLQLFLAKQADAQVFISPATQMHIQKDASIHIPWLSVDSGSMHGNWTITNYGDWNANVPVMDDTDSIHVHQQWNSIGWSQWTNFYKLTTKNPTGVTLANTLTSPVRVRDTLTTQEWVLALNGEEISLWFTGKLAENDSSYVFDNVNGGKITASGILNNPTAVNIWDLGVEITWGGNMDTVNIERQNMDQLSGQWAYLNYKISPKNQPVGNVTITMLHAPQNIQIGQDPASFDIYREDASVWLPTWATSDVPNSSVSVVLTDGFKDGLTLWDSWIPLSVQIISFSADCQNWINALNWRTATETDSNHFEVQRSTDGSAWTTIGQVMAAGNSTQEQNYVFDDEQAGEGIVYYYRFIEIDNNGNESTHSQIVASNCVVEGIYALSVFPNPTSGSLTIQLQSNTKKTMSMQVFDMNGKAVYQEDINTVFGIIQYYEDFSNLADGMYALKVWDKTVRFIVAR